MRSPCSLYPIYVNLSSVSHWLTLESFCDWSAGRLMSDGVLVGLLRPAAQSHAWQDFTCIACVSLQPPSGYSASILFPSIAMAWIMYSDQLLQLLRPFSCITSRKERLSSRNFPVSTILPLLDYFVCGAVRFAKSNLYITSIFFFLTPRNEAIRKSSETKLVLFSH